MTRAERERLSLEQLSRSAVARMRSVIFQNYSEADLRIVPGSIREEYVRERTRGHKQNLGRIRWNMLVDGVGYAVTINHDGDVYFSICIEKTDKGHIACMIPATIRNLGLKAKFAVEYAVDPSGGIRGL